MYKRIIVPLDGSTLAEVALAEAKQLCKTLGAELVLVRVVDYTNRGTLSDLELLYDYEIIASALEAEREVAVAYLAETSTALAAEGITVSTKLYDGIASQVIVALAQPGDLIVMSTHGRSGLRRWILGSVAESVLRHATVPVLLVRATEAQSKMFSEAA
jgi:nucleotide-binding universal stress UspA family protein